MFTLNKALVAFFFYIFNYSTDVMNSRQPILKNNKQHKSIDI